MGVVTSVSKIVLRSCFISIIEQTKLPEKVREGGFYGIFLGLTYPWATRSIVGAVYE